ncbi:hypothetical protein CH371_19785 [Leptospira wolffii]|uniref:Uncharacterized protein n=1 Tax=Leptospira wolffii TaxID=409998 RepID=A0A2M9Z6S6_9LEPT|nr:hypothetical protein [Leptospira wolffii]PJZ64108.1 hypothetical protein CH371_19785 [Leptospira wolffii]
MRFTEQEHIDGFAKAFIEKSYRDRFSQIKSSKRVRDKVRVKLSHFNHFIDEKIHRVAGDLQNLESIYKLLINSLPHVPDEGYIVSENSEIDGKFYPLAECLVKVDGRGLSSIISIVPGKLAYYEGEDMGERCILKENI